MLPGAQPCQAASLLQQAVAGLEFLADALGLRHVVEDKHKAFLPVDVHGPCRGEARHGAAILAPRTHGQLVRLPVAQHRVQQPGVFVRGGPQVQLLRSAAQHLMARQAQQGAQGGVGFQQTPVVHAGNASGVGQGEVDGA